MAQAFITTNKLHFKWNAQRKLDPILPETLRDVLPDNNEEIWLIHKDNAEEKGVDASNLAKAQMAVKHMQMQKMKTTYQVSYCKEDAKGQPKPHADAGAENESFENQLLEYCKHLYGRRVQKLLPPLPSGRQVNGYIRRARLFTPLTVYQNEFGRVAYGLLEK